MPNQTEIYDTISDYLKKFSQDPEFKSSPMLNIKDHKSHDEGNCVGFTVNWLVGMAHSRQKWEHDHPGEAITFETIKLISSTVNEAELTLIKSMKKYFIEGSITSEEHQNIHTYIRTINTLQSHPKSWSEGSFVSNVNLHKSIIDNKDQQFQQVFIATMNNHNISDTLMNIEKELPSGEILQCYVTEEHGNGLYCYKSFWVVYDSNVKLRNLYNLSDKNPSEKISILKKIAEEIQLNHATISGEKDFPISVIGYKFEKPGEKELPLKIFPLPDTHIETLYMAANVGGIIVEELVDKKINLNQKNHDGNTLLVSATLDNQEEIVKSLLKYKANQNILDAHGRTCAYISKYDSISKILSSHQQLLNANLGIAVKENKINSIELLLTQGADPNSVSLELLQKILDEEQTVILQILIQSGLRIKKVQGVIVRDKNSAHELILNSLDLIKFSGAGDTKQVDDLLKKKLALNMLHEDKTALMVAAEKGNIQLVECLLNAGASLETQNKSGQTAFDVAVQHRKIAIIKLLLKTSFQIYQNSLDEALYVAVIAHDEELAKVLLRRGADPNYLLIASNETILTQAVGHSSFKVAELLIENHADVDRVISIQDTKAETTPLLQAIKSKDIRIIALFLQHTSDVNATVKDEKGEFKNSVLKVAAETGDIEIFKYLFLNYKDKITIQTVADLCDALSVSENHNIKNITKYLLQWQLFHAVEQGESKLVQSLLEKKASPKIADKQGLTPLMLACESKDSLNILKQLVLQSNVNAQDLDKCTALMCAVSNNNLAAVELLLGARVDPSIKNIENQTALQIAQSFDNEIYILLLKYQTEQDEKQKILDKEIEQRNHQKNNDIELFNLEESLLNYYKKYPNDNSKNNLVTLFEKLRYFNTEKTDAMNIALGCMISHDIHKTKLKFFRKKPLKKYIINLFKITPKQYSALKEEFKLLYNTFLQKKKIDYLRAS